MSAAQEPARTSIEIGAAYDEIYRDANATNQPFPLVTETIGLVPPGAKVLDIGGGVADPLALARGGLDVTVYELSSVAVSHLNEAAYNEGLSLRATVHDARSGVNGQYRAIVLSAVLQHLTVLEAEMLLSTLEDHVPLGGLVIVVVHVSDGDYARLSRAKGGSRQYFPADAREIKSALGSGWRSETVQPFPMPMRELGVVSSGLFMRLRRVVPPTVSTARPRRNWLGRQRQALAY